uniref:KRAB domain-containing protein n=1 Tax=Pelusios castaneus TaxID=367368 RepID=A0A8C8RQB4_9SAUR
MPVTFEDVAVRFSAEEWEILEGWQKELHKEVMEKNYQLLISLGQSVPALALLSLTEEREAGGDQIPIIAGEQDLARDGGRSAGEELAFADGDPDVGQLWDSGRSGEDGCPTPAGEEERQGSLHLSALMKLVEEIPEFLFGNSKGSVEPADSEAEMGAEEASADVKAEVTPETPHPLGLESCLLEAAVGRPTRPDAPTSCASPGRPWAEEIAAENSHLQGLLSCLKEIPVNGAPHPSMQNCSRQGDMEQESREREMKGCCAPVKREVTTERSPSKELTGAVALSPRYPSTPASSARGDADKRRREPGLWKCSYEAAMAGNSPLQGLLNCLKDRIVHKPQHALPSPCKPPRGSAHRDPGQRRPASKDGSSSAAGAAAGSSSGRALPACGFSGSSSQGPETQLWGRPAGVKAKVVPKDPLLRSLENCLTDEARNSAAQPPPSHSSSSAVLRALGETPRRGTRSLFAEVKTEAGMEDSHLLSYLKDMATLSPHHHSTPPRSAPASCTEQEKEQRRVEAGLWNSSPEEVTPGTCLKEVPIHTPCASQVLASKTGADMSPRRPEARMMQWRCGAEISPENSPLQGLEKCLEEISGPGPRTSSIPVTRAVAGSQQGDMPQRRPEMGDWDFHGADTRQVLTANGHLQGPENCLAEIAAPRSSPSQAPSSSAREDAQQGRSAHVRPSGNRGEPGNLEVPALSGSELATEHLALPQKEITAARQTPSSSPAHCSSPAGSVQGDGTLKRPEVRSRKLSRKDPRAETPRLHGPETCQSEVPGPRGSRPDTPLGSSSSSPQRDVGERSPQPGRCRLHRDVLPADAFRCGLSPCPKGARESGPCHSNTLSGTSFASDASDQRRPRTPEKGIKRPYPKARTGAGRSPNTDSCTSGDDGGQKVDAEWEELPKRTCSSATPSSWGPCSCEGGKPLDPNREISAIKAILSEKLDQISQDLAAMRRDVSNIQSRMDRLDWDSRGWALELAALQKSNKCLSETMRRLENRCLVLENRSRRNSLRLAGLPEGSEGGDPITFLQRTLPIVLNLPVDSPPLEVESARRVHGGARWDPSTRPRALVFRLLRFSDKLTIMRAVRKCTEPLSCGGARVAIFPDICPKLGWRRRARCAAIRRLWRAAELHFGP